MWYVFYQLATDVAAFLNAHLSAWQLQWCQWAVLIPHSGYPGIYFACS